METDVKKLIPSETQTTESAKANGEITVVCCYCQTTIEIKKGNGVTGVSHGICYSCFTQVRELWRKDLDTYQKK